MRYNWEDENGRDRADWDHLKFAEPVTTTEWNYKCVNMMDMLVASKSDVLINCGPVWLLLLLPSSFHLKS